MIFLLPTFLLAAISLTAASPCAVVRRAVQELDQAAFEEAHQRDETATRAFSDTEIKTSDGNCLTVDPLSGDFRANLTPVQVAPCDGTDGQKWDIITNGEHNTTPNTMLVVNTLTQACLNLDPRRAAGDQVNLFSCGGRADGGGQQTDSQLFNFVMSAAAAPLQLECRAAAGTCMAVQGDVLDQAECSARGDATQMFTIG